MLLLLFLLSSRDFGHQIKVIWWLSKQQWQQSKGQKAIERRPRASEPASYRQTPVGQAATQTENGEEYVKYIVTVVGCYQ